MKNIRNIIKTLAQKGIHLYLDSGSLCTESKPGCLTPEMIHLIKSNKPTLINYLDNSNETGIEVNSLCSQIKINNNTLNVRASFSQKRLWFMNSYSKSKSQFNIPSHIAVKGIFCIESARRTLNAIIKRHESLRTNFYEENGEIIQTVVQNIDFLLETIDLVDRTAEQQQRILKQCILKNELSEFDLESDILIRASYVKLSDNQGSLLLNMSHISSDGWSLGILIREFTFIYDSYLRNKEHSLPPLTIQYRDYSAWQESLIQKGYFDNHKKFWLRKLNGAPAHHSIPLDGSRKVIPQISTGTYKSILDSDLVQSLYNLSVSSGATLFMVLQTCFAVHLGRWCQETDIVMGAPEFGREDPLLEPMIGLFLNNTVYRTQFEDNPSFLDLIKRERENHIETKKYNDFPFELLVEHLNPIRNTEFSPVFQIMINMPTSSMKSIPITDAVMTIQDNAVVQSKYDLTLYIYESEKENRKYIDFEWIYNESLFSHSMIKNSADEFRFLISEIAKKPSVPVLNYPWSSSFSTPTHKKHVSGDNNTIVTLFENAVKNSPFKVALETNEDQLDFLTLNKKVNKLARYLKENYDIGKETKVAFGMNRTFNRIIVILATLKLGAVVVPLSIELPIKRLDFILKDSNSKLLITDEENSNWTNRLVGDFGCCELLLNYSSELIDSTSFIDTNIDKVGIRDDSPAHIIYTSGTTGKPKGVIGTHGSTVSRLSWMIREFPFCDNDKASHLTSMSFIRGVWELFVPLCAGATLSIFERDLVKEPQVLLKELNSRKITRLVTAPSLLRLCLDVCRDKLSHKTEEINLSHVKYWFISGEPLDSILANKVNSHFPKIDFYNLYGSTEVMSDVLFYKINGDERLSNVPLGKPITSANVLLVDKNKNPVPKGVIGELLVVSKSVAQGYNGLEDLTQSKFIQSPLGRGYLTGDLCRILEDDNIAFVGRIDNQVKLRGYRIELNEIRALITDIAGIENAAVIVNGEQIFAYISLSNDFKNHINIDEFITGVRASLIQFLPSYMIPSRFILLDDIPLKSNGKIDTRALENSNGTLITNKYKAPATNIEIELSKIWASLVGLNAVDISANADFFVIGGHSLMAIRLISKIKVQFNVSLSLSTIFKNSELQALALQINEQCNAIGDNTINEIRAVGSNADETYNQDIEEVEI